MAELTFTLKHGLRTGKGTTDEMLHKDVTLRELTSRDVIESQLASERVVIGEHGKAVAYCSEVMMGLEMMRRQIKKIGEIIPEGYDKGEDIAGLVQVLPIRKNRNQGRWQVGPTELKNRIEQGRIRLSGKTHYGYVINYLADGEYNKVLEGLYEIVGYADDGSMIAYESSDESSKYRTPPTQWRIASHDATEYGTNLLTNILGEKRFTFPKSLYAVLDTIRFFVANKPNAVVLDFFAGFRVIIMTRADSNDEYRILASLQKNKIEKVG